MSAPMDSGRGCAAADKIITKQSAAVVAGIHTDIVCSAFDDRIFITVTQYGKLGTLIHVKKDAVLRPGDDPTYTTRILLGKDEPINHVVARNLASQISTQKPILLALGVKDTSIPSLKAMEKLVLQNDVWS